MSLILPPLVGFVLISLAAVWATNTLARRVVGGKHRLIEEIVTTGEIPAAWRRTGRSPANQARVLRRLDDLIRYTQGSPLVDDEETRQILLDRLLAVRDAWSAGEGRGGEAR